MYTATTEYIKQQGITEPTIGLILGSGLGDLANEIQNAIEIDYQDIPDFPVSTVEGHDGKLVYGDLASKKVIALKGRFHYYEGYDLNKITFPVRIFKDLGVKTVIITNAAGGVNETFSPGDLMIITDHINLTGENPLIGPNYEAHGPRFVDMTETYSRRGQELLKQIAADNDIEIKEGVYTWFTGPTYETPAEIKAVRVMGGDAVGMSTVPEAVVAKHAGLEVVGISCITNLAAGMQTSLNHEEVVEVSTLVKPRFKLLLTELMKEL
ncbi:purine-nucleoside phosphorylase [Aerococcaceae bacterium WGS1372]